MTSRQLYGGAITVTLPQQYEDISRFREVPDYQEVFADAATDRSIVIEVLELEEPDSSVPRHYFNEQARMNEVSNTRVLKSGSFDAPHAFKAGTSSFFLIGVQDARKFRENVRNTVMVSLAVIRLASVTTDLVVILNYPLAIHPESSSFHDGENAVLGEFEDHVKDGEMLLRNVVDTLHVRDWNLFQ